MSGSMASAREPDAFPHAAGELARRLIPDDVRIEPDLHQTGTDALVDLAAAHLFAVLTQRKRDVFGDRQTVEERRHLKDESVPRARFRELLVAERRDILSVEKNAPFGRRDETDHILQKDRLAAAALPDNRDRFPATDR